MPPGEPECEFAQRQIRTVDAGDPAVPSFAMNTASRVATGVAGIVAVVLLFAGQFVGAIGSRTEPAFDSSTREIVAFLGSLRSGPQTAGSVIVLVGLVAFLTFAAGLRDVLAPGGLGLPALAVRTAQLCAVA